MRETSQTRRLKKIKEAKKEGNLLKAIDNHFFIHFGFQQPFDFWKK